MELNKQFSQSKTSLYHQLPINHHEALDPELLQQLKEDSDIYMVDEDEQKAQNRMVNVRFSEDMRELVHPRLQRQRGGGTRMMETDFLHENDLGNYVMKPNERSRDDPPMENSVRILQSAVRQAESARNVFSTQNQMLSDSFHNRRFRGRDFLPPLPPPEKDEEGKAQGSQKED